MNDSTENIADTAVWQKIQQRLETERETLRLETAVFPELVYPGKPTDIPYDVILYNQLADAAQHIPQFEREPLLVSSPWENIPLVGPLFAKLRSGLHNISLFYTNRSQKHQTEVNQQLLESIGRLTAVTQQQQRQIQSLQRQMQAHKQTNP